MPISRRSALLALALLLAACQSLQPETTLPEPLTGQVKRACGPTDAPALDFSLASDDGETTVAFYLWQNLPDEPTRLPIRRAAIDTFHGELCTSGDCQPIERLGMTIDPTQPGQVVGTLTVQSQQATGLRGEFRAAWTDEPGPICG